MNELLSWPWRTRCHYHVFWSFGPSFLLNQWSCVVCPLCVTSGHLGIRWCAVGKPWAGLGLEPPGAGPRAGARLLALYLFLPAAVSLGLGNTC